MAAGTLSDGLLHDSQKNDQRQPCNWRRPKQNRRSLPINVLGYPAFGNREVNPYNWLLYTHLAALGVTIDEYSPTRLLLNKYDIWHLHWPELCLKHRGPKRAGKSAQTFLTLMDQARQRSVKIVWTAHNLSSHDQVHPGLETGFWNDFTNRVDGHISLSKTGLEAIHERFPRLKQVPSFVVPHGHYRGEYQDTLNRQSARAQLGIANSAKVLLFFGKIRPYKNVAQLIRTFRAYPDPTAILIVVGEVKERFPENAERIKSESAGDSRVRLELGHVPGDRVQVYFRSADLVVLPYREIFSSGVTLLALSFDRPVLLPLQGAVEEMQTQVGAEWMRTYTGEISPEVIEDGLDWALHDKRPIRPSLDLFDWGVLALKTLDAYRHILAR